jgi:transposase
LNGQLNKELQKSYAQAKDGGTRTRLQAVWLCGRGYLLPGILEITGCNRTSLMEWCRKYRQSGVAALEDHRGGPVRAKLKAAQVAELQIQSSSSRVELGRARTIWWLKPSFFQQYLDSQIPIQRGAFCQA